MVGIRVDANQSIATGHMMRCLSIAKELRKLGQNVLFIVSDDMADCMAKNAGFEAIKTGFAYDKKEEELKVLISLLKDRNIEVLLLDSYQVNEACFKALSECVRLAYIDDTFEEYVQCRLLICYHVGVSSQDFDQADKKFDKMLLGVKYFPLREEFCRGKDCVAAVVKDVFVSTGGTDPLQVTEKILEAFDYSTYPVKLHVVVGKMFTDVERLDALARDNKSIVLYKDVSDSSSIKMSDIMKQCDIAITAGGTTVGELAALHVPCVAFAFADNQELIFKYENEGLIAKAVDIRRTDSVDVLLDAVYELINDVSKRQTVYEKQAATIDGLGARRIAEELLKI